MWRLNKVRHKAGGQRSSLDELKLQRREHEKVLRQARRDRQLVSKRLLLIDDEDQPEIARDSVSGEQDVVSLFHKVRHSAPGREVLLKALSKALRHPTAQLTFIKQENSVHVLVGLLTGSDAQCRLQAVRCFHVLSHSPNPVVALACLPATSYLLTYLSGQSTKFTELCLYTLGNLCPDSDAVTEKLLAQGIIPALATCIETQRHNLAVVEAAAFTLSQLLQAKDAEEKIIPVVLDSSLPSHLLSMLTLDPQFGLAPAIESAWCLHYLTCSAVNNRALLAQDALLRCSSLLVSLGGAVVEGNKGGMELLICPLLRCVGNFVASGLIEELNTHVGDAQLLVALCTFLQTYLHTQPALARESAWVLNNLTAHSSPFCSTLLTLNLVPGLVQLLPFSQGINTMVLRVLGNVAHKKMDFCAQLSQSGLLPALCATLRMADCEMVILSLDILFMLVADSPQTAEDFARQGGISLLETIQYNSNEELRRKATYLLEHYLKV
ncbi:transmembrane and coiled-coil domain-containing protein 6 [Thalassophryne amazonica]|uniref:transmembrane and coiled-coil domain-containing protein 6 n=1 Tax=Thalassophryne amazonica TaxID=390379 RepID=UPI0014723803|nr:transmembrane and coiled-coil domain-containing protein 6 [Thalassophryne amazonica]